MDDDGVLFRHNDAIIKLAEGMKTTRQVLHHVSEWMDAQAEFNNEAIRVIESLITDSLQANADMARLRRLQEQFVALQEMFGTKLAKVERISPPQLSVIEGGRDGGER